MRTMFALYVVVIVGLIAACFATGLLAG